jgi:4-hydroxybenzoate polyprenyltransferase
VWVLLTFLNILLRIPVNCNNLHFCTVIIFRWLTLWFEQWFIIKDSEHSCPRHLITNGKLTAILFAAGIFSNE